MRAATFFSELCAPPPHPTPPRPAQEPHQNQSCGTCAALSGLEDGRKTQSVAGVLSWVKLGAQLSTLGMELPFLQILQPPGGDEAEGPLALSTPQFSLPGLEAEAFLPGPEELTCPKGRQCRGLGLLTAGACFHSCKMGLQSENASTGPCPQVRSGCSRGSCQCLGRGGGPCGCCPFWAVACIC